MILMKAFENGGITLQALSHAFGTPMMKALGNGGIKLIFAMDHLSCQRYELVIRKARQAIARASQGMPGANSSEIKDDLSIHYGGVYVSTMSSDGNFS